MKRLYLFLLLIVATQFSVLAQITFTWENPDSIHYRATDTLKVESDELTSFNCTFSLADPLMSEYLALNGNTATVLKCYNQGDSADYGKIFINAYITNINPYHADTMITGYVRTAKISPNLRWTCQLGDMLCGDSVQLTSAHDNTDTLIFVTYEAQDYHAQKSTYVDIQGSTMKAMSEGRGVYTTVTIEATDNFLRERVSYLSNDSIIRFDVYKLDRTITWDSTDFKSLTNLSPGIELHTQYADNQDTVVYTSSDISVAEVVNGNFLKINAPGRVTITAFVDGGIRYHDCQSDTVIDIPVVGTTIFWEESVIESQKSKISSTAANYNLNVLAGSNYTNGTSYHFTSSDTSIARVFGDTLLTCYRMGSFDLSAYAFNSVGGQSPTITHNIDVSRGFLRFVKDGKWSDRTNWNRSDLDPSSDDYSVEMLAKCTIPDGETATCYDLNIYAQGGIVVEPEGVLNVVNSLINNAGEEELVIKADRHNQGAIYFRQGSPLAKVEVWMDMSSAAGADTLWAYKGIPVDTTNVRNPGGKIKIYQYSERNGWKNISSMMTQLRAWEAYRMTDTMPSLYTFEGRLNAGIDHRFDLGYDNDGMNIIVNSYSAPIDIRALEFDGALEELHYPIGQQWGCAPKYTAAAIGNKGIMRSGDALFVQAEAAGASVTMDYEKSLLSDFEEEDFNVLKVIISGAKYSDTVALVACANGTGDYESGYDGTKWLGADTMPQIFATADWGRASVNAEQSIIGQNIGVIAANDAELYNITFDTKRMRGYDQLYLYDMKTQVYTDILAGQPYGFTTTRLGEDKRFTIVRDKIEGTKDKYGHGFVVAGNRVLLIGFGNEHSMVRIYNAAGVVVYEFWSDEGPWVELPDLLNGVYIINSGVSYTKFYR